MPDISCSASDLAAVSQCLECLTPPQKQAAIIYLLCQLAGVEANPVTLATLAAPFMAMNKTQMTATQNYLLCTILGG